MALTASDFVEPTGELQHDWFPLTATERAADAAGTGGYASDEAKLYALLAGWIAQADAAGHDIAVDAVDEGAAVSYVYRRAYMHVSRRLLTNPAEGDATGVASYAYAARQLNYWQDRLATLEATAPGAAGSAYDDWPVVHSLR